MADVPSFLQASDDDASAAPAALQDNDQAAAPSPSSGIVPLDVSSLPQDEVNTPPDDEKKTALTRSMESLVKDHPWLAGFHGKGILGAYLPQDQLPSDPAGNVASLGNPLSAVAPPSGAPESTAEPQSGEMPIQSANAQAATPPPTDEQNVQQFKQAKNQDYLTEVHNYQKDLDDGHIKPETYSDLFAKKDTLGKIGTIFGLMLSGAGSGLTGQPNQLLAMMNTEIQNDLEAQKSSSSNKQSFVKLAQEAVMNKYHAQSLNTQQQVEALSLAQAHGMQSAVHDLAQKVKSLPDGSPQKTQAQQALAIIGQQAQGVIVDSGDRAASIQAMLNFSNPGGISQASQGSGAVDYQKMNQLERASQMKMFGAPSSEDLQNMTKEAQHLEEARSLRTDFNQAFDALDKSALAGKFSPNQRESYINSLAGKLAKVSAGRYNENEAKNQIESMVPKSTDFGSTRDVKKQNNQRFFDIEEAGTPTLDRFGVKNSPQGSKVKVMSPSGQIGSIPEENLKRALQMKYQVVK